MVVNVTENLMGRLNPGWVEHFKKLKSHEHRVAWTRNYPIQNGEEEAVIQLLVDKLDPALPSVTRVSQVRDEMQRDEAKGDKAGHRLDTQEGELYWQDRLDAAMKLDQTDAKAELKRRHDEIRKLFPDLLGLEELEPSTTKAPVISVNPDTKEATIAEPEFTPGPESAVTTDQEKDLINVAGFGKDTVRKFMDKGIICQKQLFDLTYSQAISIAKTPLVLAKIKDKFKAEK
jgi:hypothetical protein